MAEGLEFGVKKFELFFDRQHVLDRLSKKEARVLSLTGLRGRDNIRRNIKKAPKKHPKNRSKYPYSHGNRNEGLRYVLFNYDSRKASVIVGPQKFTSSVQVYATKQGRVRLDLHSKTVPQLLNEGGTAGVIHEYKSGNTYNTVRRYRAMPFVTDAMPKTIERMKQLISQVGL